MNDTPGECQIRGVTEPKRDRGTTIVVDEEIIKPLCILENYIVDFFISSKRIVIELDGRQHGFEENIISDKERDNELNKLGITVLRYKNIDINQNFVGVCKDILDRLQLEESDLKEIK